jgi:ion channel-forming bestrophin family protein
MIVKRVFNPLKVVSYVKYEMLYATVISLIMALLSMKYHLTLPFSIAAILGSALAIFIAFRNNSSYSRWWEARTLWGGIINSNRVLARLVISFADSHSNSQLYQQEKSHQFKTSIIYLSIAWCHCLRLHLRKQTHWEELKQNMGENEFRLMLEKQNKPNYIQLLISKKIYEAMNSGVLAGFDSFQLEGQLLTLANYQGGCERIKNTPLLRQYDFFTRVFLYVFMSILPLCLIGDFQKLQIEELMVPISIIISFVFAIIGKVGEVNEDPFENRITDVPLSALCNTIERDLREMLGETELPIKLESSNGYLY